VHEQNSCDRLSATEHFKIILSFSTSIHLFLENMLYFKQDKLCRVLDWCYSWNRSGQLQWFVMA